MTFKTQRFAACEYSRTYIRHPVHLAQPLHGLYGRHGRAAGKYAEFLSAYLENHSAPGSDSGLCIVPPLGFGASRTLMDFGLRAKKEVLTMNQAYCLARELGVHLSEHGGTGGGVIGALAGIGFRLWGNNGSFRGWYHLGQAGSVMTTGGLRRYKAIEDIPPPTTRRACASRISSRPSA